MILPIVKQGHAKLRAVCAPADPKKAHHKTLARRLVETMKSHEALGIAANQVNPGELIRIIAVNIPEYTGAMFNPEILLMTEEKFTSKEGCLSLKQKVRVSRAKNIMIQFQTNLGEKKSLTLSDLSAAVIQHEIDHLNGVLATDY